MTRRTMLQGLWVLLLAVGVVGVIVGCQNQNSFMGASTGGRLGVMPKAASIPSRPLVGHEGAAAVPPLPADEVWVIAKAPRHDGTQPAARDDDAPGSGAMLAMIPPVDLGPDAAPRQVPLPLKHTDVRARVDGYIASVEVTQQFHNPFAEKIEAVYVFPLPQDAAVNDFIMTIGDRKIRG